MKTKQKKDIQIFLVEDDEMYGSMIKESLCNEQIYNVTFFLDGESMLDFKGLKPDIVILDYYLDSKNENAKNGAEILDTLMKENPNLPVIILSSSQEIEKAVHLLKFGATDYILKNNNAFENLKKSLNNIIHINSLETEIKDLRNRETSMKLRVLIAFILLILFFTAIIWLIKTQ